MSAPSAAPTRPPASAKPHAPAAALGLGGSALERELVALGVAEPAAGGAAPSLVEHLGRWMHWTDTLALSAALTSMGPGPVPTTPTSAPARAAQPPRAAPRATDAAPIDSAGAALQALQRTRAALEREIADDGALRPAAPAATPGLRPGAAAAPRTAASPPLEWADCRRHLIERQRRMAETLAGLRARLREALLRHRPDLAPLVALDAALEQALAPREQALLGTVPSLLDGRLRQLKKRAAADQGTGTSAGAAAAPTQAAFLDELQRVLRAELALRLHPLEGLVAAFDEPRAAPSPPIEPTP